MRRHVCSHSIQSFKSLLPCLCFLQLKISFQVFDREGEDGKFVSVTVKATDSGQPSLEGVCSFTVEITDVNDNPPLFDRQVTSLTTL